MTDAMLQMVLEALAAIEVAISRLGLLVAMLTLVVALGQAGTAFRRSRHD